MKNTPSLIYLMRLSVVAGVALLLASCGGGSGPNTATAPNEVINGIAVPPEPDPVKNNATIAGIDVNNNGVRDDVERKIASEKKDFYTGAILTAKLQQAKILGNSDQDKAIRRELACNKKLNIPIGTYGDILDIVANTKERKELFQKTTDFDEIPEEC